jgi:hypothetical protein
MSDPKQTVILIFHRLPMRLSELECCSIYSEQIDELKGIAKNHCSHPSIICISKYEYYDDLKNSLISKYAKKIYLLNENDDNVQLESSFESKTKVVNNERDLETELHAAYIACCRDAVQRYHESDQGLANRAAMDAERGQ